MKRGLVIIGVLILVGVVYWLSGRSQPVSVWVAEVRSGLVEATVANTRAGTIKACRRSRLSMPVGGVVDRLLVAEGDRVEGGQLLLELWNRDQRAATEEAEQQIRVADSEQQRSCLQAEFNQREYQRLARLASKNLASEDSVDNALTRATSQRQACAAATGQVAVARARADYHRAVLDRTRLLAPFSGIVAEVNGELGEYVTPSPPGIVTPPAVDLIDDSCSYVTAPIDEVDASRLRIGQQTRVTLDAFRGREFAGELTRIAPYVVDLERQARTVDVDVRLLERPAELDFLVGYSADITVILERREDVVRVPSEALLAGSRVWLWDPVTGRVSLRDVTTGIANWSWTEITAGLAVGDWVIKSPDQADLAEGVIAVARDD